MEHLELMDYARSSANLRSYGQREPLMEYRRESMRLFRDFWDCVRRRAVEEAAGRTDDAAADRDDAAAQSRSEERKGRSEITGG